MNILKKWLLLRQLQDSRDVRQKQRLYNEIHADKFSGQKLFERVL